MPEVPELVTLRSEHTSVVIDPRRGARAVSWRVDGMELLASRSDAPVENGMYPMAPWAGRLRGNGVRKGSTWHDLPITHSGWALHGTVLALAADEVTISETEPSLVAVFGQHPGWPWSTRVSVEWRLSGRTLDTTITVLAAEEAFPAVVGWHPWFRRQLEVGAPATWSLAADGRLRRGADHLPTGAMDPFDPDDGPFDDAFRVPDGRAQVRWPGALGLEVESDGGWYVVFDELPDQFCIEPQSGPPDGLLEVDRPAAFGPVRMARPGLPLSLRTRWTATGLDGSA